MAKIIGIRPSTFTGDKGEVISGVNIYVTYSLDKGQGLGAERVYLTDAKIKDGGYQPKVGDEVNLQYNKWGKCSAVVPIKS